MRGFLILSCILYLSCSKSDDLATNPPIPKPSTPNLLATNMKFTEGPAWCDDGYLLFSDTDGDVIYKWSEVGGLSTFVTSAQKPNGIVFGNNEFFVCRHSTRDIAKLSKNGILTSYITTYKGKKLNSPNDIAMNFNGDIYFTDPDYGVKAEDRELEFEGLFFVAKGNNSVVLIDDTMAKPNGVALSPNQDILYVCESSTNSIYSFDISANGSPVNKRLLCKLTGKGEVDGVVCNKEGYLFVAYGDGGVIIVSPNGERYGMIYFPERVRNLCFSEDNLYVTAGKSLYSVDFISL